MDKRQYEHAHEQAERLHDRIGDLIDDASHHLGRELIENGHRIASEIRSQKKPRSIESTVKNILQTLQRIRSEGDVIMDFRHIDMFIGEYQNLQMSLRKFENY